MLTRNLLQNRPEVKTVYRGRSSSRNRAFAPPHSRGDLQTQLHLMSWKGDSKEESHRPLRSEALTACYESLSADPRVSWDTIGRPVRGHPHPLSVVQPLGLKSRRVECDCGLAPREHELEGWVWSWKGGIDREHDVWSWKKIRQGKQVLAHLRKEHTSKRWQLPDRVPRNRHPRKILHSRLTTMPLPHPQTAPRKYWIAGLASPAIGVRRE